MIGINNNTMTDLNRSALNFHISSVDRVQQLCDPLKYLGITTFGYMKIFDDSRYLHICNHDRWSRYFMKNVHDAGKLFSKVMSVVGSELVSFIWPEETTDDLLLALKSQDIFYGLVFYKRTKNFIESWAFSAPHESAGIYDLYLNHSDLLWKFAQYFCESAQDLIDHSDSGKLGVYSKWHNIPQARNLLRKDDIGKFLQGIETKTYLINCNYSWAFISEMEKQCLELVSKGLKQSNQMGLTSHAIDRRLEEVKLRLSATSIDELLKAFNSSTVTV